MHVRNTREANILKKLSNFEVSVLNYAHIFFVTLFSGWGSARNIILLWFHVRHLAPQGCLYVLKIVKKLTWLLISA